MNDFILNQYAYFYLLTFHDKIVMFQQQVHG